MKIIKRPPAIHTAFNPIILEVKREGKERSARVSIQSGSAGSWIRTEKEFLNNTLQFDLSPIFKSMFKEGDASNNIYRDERLFVYHHVGLSSNIAPAQGSIGIMAINAVAQIGESSDLTSQKGTFRTKQEKILLYEGYPREAVILGMEETTTILNADDQEVELPFFSVTLKKSDSIKIQGGQELPIESPCIPKNPFYVKWINQQGGWDYWMFSFRQKIKQNIENQKFFNPLVLDQERASGFKKEYHKEASSTITVGEEFLNENEFDVLSRLPYSPMIQFYDKEKERWFDLLIKETNVEDDTSDSAKFIEFTFELPTPQLQC